MRWGFLKNWFKKGEKENAHESIYDKAKRLYGVEEE
jgi:hypothetical protein